MMPSFEAAQSPPGARTDEGMLDELLLLPKAGTGTGTGSSRPLGYQPFVSISGCTQNPPEKMPIQHSPRICTSELF